MRGRRSDGPPRSGAARRRATSGSTRLALAGRRPISFPTAGGRTAHALVYPPANPDVRRPDGRAAAAHRDHATADRRRRPSPTLRLDVQFWTQPRVRRRRRQLRRLDRLRARLPRPAPRRVGRRRRRRLRRRGDLAGAEAGSTPDAPVHRAAARPAASPPSPRLAFRDDVHRRRRPLRRRRPGGPGPDTHKFESRYLDGLVGPYPAAADVYDGALADPPRRRLRPAR